MALQWNQSWKQTGVVKSQSSQLRQQGNRAAREHMRKANKANVGKHVQVKAAKLKLADTVRQKIVARTPFRTQSQAPRRARDTGLRQGAIHQAGQKHQQQFLKTRSAAKGLADLANTKAPNAAGKQAVAPRSEAPQTQTQQHHTQAQPQTARVPDRSRQPAAPKKTRGQTKTKGKAKLAQDPKQVAKQAAKLGVKLPKGTEVKQTAQAATAAAAQTKGHTGKKGEAKLATKKGKESSLTENVGKKTAGRLKKLNEGGGSAQTDVNVNVSAKDSEEWQPSESNAVAAAETKGDGEKVSRYDFPKGKVAYFNEPGPADDVGMEAMKFKHNVLQPKVANAARVNDIVTEQLEKIALSDKVISNDPEVKALLRKCMNGKRVSPGGGGMHA